MHYDALLNIIQWNPNIVYTPGTGQSVHYKGVSIIEGLL